MWQRDGGPLAPRHEEASIPSVSLCSICPLATLLHALTFCNCKKPYAIPLFLVSSDLKTGFRPRNEATASTHPYDSAGQALMPSAGPASSESNAEVKPTELGPTQSTVAVPSPATADSVLARPSCAFRSRLRCLPRNSQRARLILQW